MSDDDGPDLAPFRTRLEQEREQLRDRLERLQAQADDEAWTQAKPDEADQGAAAVERERLRSLAGQARQALDGVEAALRRIVDGTYGKCQACGGAIPAERLDARPEADLCLDCQSQRR